MSTHIHYESDNAFCLESIMEFLVSDKCILEANDYFFKHDKCSKKTPNNIYQPDCILNVIQQLLYFLSRF
jgi:hypothetical protein